MSSSTPKEPAIKHRYADLGEVRLHYVEAGEGLWSCSYGFPEFWYSWRYRIPALVEDGFAWSPQTCVATISPINPRGCRTTASSCWDKTWCV